MRADDIPLALLGFLALVVTAPLWTLFQGNFTASRPEIGYIAALILPSAAILWAVSEIKPEMTRMALGGIVLVAMVLVLAPWWLRFTDMAAAQLSTSPLTRLVMRIGVPAIVISALVSLGRRTPA